MSAGAIRYFDAADHARNFLDARVLAERSNGCVRRLAIGDLRYAQMLVRLAGNLGEVGNT